MVNPLIELAGTRFGRLLVSRRAPKPSKEVWWVCYCDCGAITTKRGRVLREGQTKSCGCLARELSSKRAIIHSVNGHTYENSATFRSWAAMLQRCNNPKSKSYHQYGGRGIKVCKHWHVFANFLADMGERPAGKTLDRINVDGGYHLSNCRWASNTTQARNRRR